MQYRLREIEESDLELLLNWRNSDRIRKQMYHDSLISLEEHRAWFERVSKWDHCKYLLFLVDEEPYGHVNFTEISLDKRSAKWGFYIGKEAAPKGLGTKMALLALDYIFSIIDTVYGEVLNTNIASLKYHQKLGFRNVGEKENVIFRDGEWVGVQLFELTKQDWQQQRRQFTY
ncbi:UDP-4-amino-4,6-dideoxy-N-acetyl-beta-L-altrosamine N-acetyltransferase [Brevibacillus sp. GCM10020057]|uniref:UDP-4-amino-4, 6-dideoxy-N-acetyl-beta-L-altrosamine N-acetyltransferase n=1 Tax=Brevibacillus sp. GCM10020057 TaxID=3317327 RepID=UPI0036455CD7